MFGKQTVNAHFCTDFIHGYVKKVAYLRWTLKQMDFLLCLFKMPKLHVHSGRRKKKPICFRFKHIESLFILFCWSSYFGSSFPGSSMDLYSIYIAIYSNKNDTRSFFWFYNHWPFECFARNWEDPNFGAATIYTGRFPAYRKIHDRFFNCRVWSVFSSIQVYLHLTHLYAGNPLVYSGGRLLGD